MKNHSPLPLPPTSSLQTTEQIPGGRRGIGPNPALRVCFCTSHPHALLIHTDTINRVYFSLLHTLRALSRRLMSFPPVMLVLLSFPVLASLPRTVRLGGSFARDGEMATKRSPVDGSVFDLCRQQKWVKTPIEWQSRTT